MNKRTILYFSAIIIAFLFLFYAQYNWFSYREQTLKYERGRKQFLDSTNINGLQDVVLMYGNAININLKKNMMVTDSAGHQIKFGKLIDRKKIIYHFSETNCMTCVEKFLPSLISLSKRVGEKNILILGSYSAPKILFLSLKKYDIQHFAIYNLAPNLLQNEKVEQLNMPYIFSIDTTFRVNNVFVPQKEMPQLTDKYENYF